MRAAGLAALTGLAMTAVLALSACTEPAPPLPEVPSTLELMDRPTVTRPPDLSDVSLPALEGAGPTSTIKFSAGAVSIAGVVTGPDGPVAGATVRLERVVGDQTATATVSTDGKGQWKLGGVNGGIVRVHAFRVPDLGMEQSTLVFASGKTEVDLELKRYEGTNLQWALAPSQPLVGRPMNLVVQVSVKRVDPDGIVRTAVLGGIGVNLVPLGALQPQTLDARITDEAGRASFLLGCTTAGTSMLRVVMATGEESTISPEACTVPATVPPSTLPPSAVPQETVPLATVPPVEVPVTPVPDVGAPITVLPG